MVRRISSAVILSIVFSCNIIFAQTANSDYQQGYQKWLAKDYEQAILILQKIPEDSLYAIPATILLAKSHLSANRPTEAITLCSTAISANHPSDDLYYQRALAYIATNRWRLAMKDLQVIQSKQAKNPYVNYQLGLCLKNQQMMDQAIEAWKNTIAVYPNFVGAHQELGLAYLEKKESALSQEHLEKAGRIKPDLPLVQYGLGMLYLSRDDKVTAQSYFEKAVQIQPNHGPSWYQLALLFAQQKQWDTALTAYQKALPNSKELQPIILAEQAQIRYELKQYQESLNDLDQALSIEMEPPPRWFFQRAMIMIAMQKNDEALANLDTAITGDPKCWEAYRQRAKLYLANKQYQYTIKQCNILEKEEQADAYTYYYRGRAKFEQKDYREALQDYNTAKNKASNLVEVYLGLCDTLLCLAQNDPNAQEYLQTALNHINRAIALDESQAEYYAKRSYVKELLKQYPSALQDIQKAIELDGNPAHFYYQRACIYNISESQQPSEALNDLNTALTKNSQYHSAYALRASIYFEMQNYDSALKDYDSAIQFAVQQDPKQIKFKITPYYLQKSKILLLQSKWNEAIENLTHAIELEPDQDKDVYYFCRAQAYLGADKNDKALEDATKAIESKNKKEYFELRSKIFTRLQRSIEAEADQQTAQELDN